MYFHVHKSQFYTKVPYMVLRLCDLCHVRKVVFEQFLLPAEFSKTGFMSEAQLAALFHSVCTNLDYNLI